MLESRVCEELDEFAVPRRGVTEGAAFECGNGDFIDEMAEERRLREQLDVEKIGRRL